MVSFCTTFLRSFVQDTTVILVKLFMKLQQTSLDILMWTSLSEDTKTTRLKDTAHSHVAAFDLCVNSFRQSSKL